jgi:hypothetical protein
MAKPYEITIREAHLDSYGHVNNAAYLEINLKFIKEVRLRERVLMVMPTPEWMRAVKDEG